MQRREEQRREGNDQAAELDKDAIDLGLERINEVLEQAAVKKWLEQQDFGFVALDSGPRRRLRASQ